MAPANADDWHLFPRTSDPSNPPLASVFALVLNQARALSSRAIHVFSESLSSRDTQKSTAAVTKLAIIKRQNSDQILVIPTTYAGLNSGPAPGAVVGITLGSILGFLLIVGLIALAFRAAGFGGNDEVIEEEIIRRHTHRSRSQSTRQKSSTSSPMSEPRAPPPVVREVRRESRQTRRGSRRQSRVSRRENPPDPEMVIVEEEMSEQREPDEVIVEEEEDDEIIEVIEEHSPEPPPRRPKKKDGHYRTVDPGEFGGGDAPPRRVGRR